MLLLATSTLTVSKMTLPIAAHAKCCSLLGSPGSSPDLMESESPVDMRALTTHCFTQGGRGAPCLRPWSPVSAAVEPRLLHRHLCTWLVFLSLISTRLSKKFVLNINLASVLYLRCFPPQVAVFSTSFMDTLLRSRHPSCEFRVSGLFWFRNLSLFHDYSVSQHLPTFMCNDLFPSAGTSPA